MSQWPHVPRELPDLPHDQGTVRVHVPKVYPLVGMDTETRRGNVHMIADSEGNMICDVDEPIPLKELLAFLHRPKRTVVWYNMQYDLECILKQLSQLKLMMLWEGLVVEQDDYDMKTFMPKFFSIRHGRYATKHYDVAQFYRESLEKAAQRHLDSGKLQDVDRTKLGTNKRYWKRNLTKIKRYCTRDAMLTQALGETWQRLLETSNLPVSFISSGSISGAWGYKWGLTRTTTSPLLQEIATDSYYGGRFECRYKGTIEGARVQDLNSAYPAVMANLPDARTTNWKRTENEREAVDADWGFVLASYKVPELPWCPLPVRLKDGLVLFPQGSISQRWYTLDEYRSAILAGATTRFVKAWVGNDNGDRPFSFVEQAWKLKERFSHEDDPRSGAIKIVANGLYGKLIESRPKNVTWRKAQNGHLPRDAVLVHDTWYYPHGKGWNAGPLYDAITASHVTARTRIACFEAAQEVETALIATDGIVTFDRLPSKMIEPDKLGGWKHEAHGKALIVGNGLYQVEGKKRTRGFKRPGDGFDWFSILEKMRPGAWTFTVRGKRPVHPGECMVRHDLSLEDVGAFVPNPKKFNLNDDRKRAFPHVTAKKLLSGHMEGVPLRPGDLT